LSRSKLRFARPSVFTPFLRRWFTDERALELAETRRLYDIVSRRYAASAWAGDQPRAFRHIIDTLTADIDRASQHLPKEVRDAFFATWCQVIELEEVLYDPPDVDWNAPLTLKEAVDLRNFLRAQEYCQRRFEPDPGLVEIGNLVLTHPVSWPWFPRAGTRAVSSPLSPPPRSWPAAPGCRRGACP
jgi:hypothetical protein